MKYTITLVVTDDQGKEQTITATANHATEAQARCMQAAAKTLDHGPDFYKKSVTTIERMDE